MKIFVLIFFLTLSQLQAKEILHVSSGFPKPETYLVGSIVQEGFDRAGVAIKYHTLPTERSLVNVNLGLDDVEAGRIKGIEKLYPNLMMVPVSIHKIDIVLLSKKRLRIKKISDLKPYHVGLNRGVKIAESIAKKANARSITPATSYKMLIKMLINNRVDVIITSKIAMLTMLAETSEESLFMTKEPLVSLPLYTYFNKKHKDLIPKLKIAYESMQDDGTLKKLQTEFFYKLKNKISSKVTITDD